MQQPCIIRQNAKFITFAMVLMLSWTSQSKIELPNFKISPVFQRKGCITSTFNPSDEAAGCLPFGENVESGLAFDNFRRLVFGGSSDESLTIMDFDVFKIFRKIPTKGRVVTTPILEEFLIYGTEKGEVVIHNLFNFEKILNVSADSKVNNDLVLFENHLLFTSALGTVYCVDLREKKLKWSRAREFTGQRLRLKSRSNLIVSKNAKNITKSVVFAPHSDGKIYVFNVFDGTQKKVIDIGKRRKGSSFPDIVAPMVLWEKELWVSSFDQGVFVIDINSREVIKRLELLSLTQMVRHKEQLVFLSEGKLGSVDSTGRKLWTLDLKSFRAKIARNSNHFFRQKFSSDFVFAGAPSALQVFGDKVIFSFSHGGTGIVRDSDGTVFSIFPKQNMSSIVMVGREGVGNTHLGNWVKFKI